jgi:hypothetical protein
VNIKWKAKLDKIGTFTINDGEPRIADEYISALENALSTTLPSGYRSFVEAIKAPLGIYSPSFDAEGGEGSVVSVFFAEDPKKSYDLLDTHRRYMGRVPSSLLPIANDPGGNLVCIGIAAPDLGKVYFWDHERESTSGFPHRDNIFKIADSFGTFIDQLQPADDDD